LIPEWLLATGAGDGVPYQTTPEGRWPQLVTPAGRSLSNNIQLSAQVLEELRHLLEVPATTVLRFRVAPPGAFQKMTVEVRSPAGVVHSYLKTAFAEAASSRLENEAEVLTALCGLGGSVPTVLSQGEWQGRRYLQLSAGPSSPGPRALRSIHVKFMNRLPTASKPLAETGGYRNLIGGRELIAAELGSDLGPMAAAWIERLPGVMGVVSMGWGHGDFTRANTTVGGGRLFVFDWEAATPEVPVGYDLFHFTARPGTASARPLSTLVGNRRLRGVVAGLQGRPPTEAWAVGWLAHLTLDYSFARSHYRPPSPGPVWRWIIEQWRDLARW